MTEADRHQFGIITVAAVLGFVMLIVLIAA